MQYRVGEGRFCFLKGRTGGSSFFGTHEQNSPSRASYLSRTNEVFHVDEHILVPFEIALTFQQVAPMLVLRLIRIVAAVTSAVAVCTNAVDPEHERITLDQPHVPHAVQLRTYQLLPLNDRLEQAERNVRPRLLDSQEQQQAGQLLQLGTSAAPSSPPVFPPPELDPEYRGRSRHLASWQDHPSSSSVAPYAGEGSSQQARDLIPAFVDGKGQPWGPFRLHESHFQTAAYPLEMPRLSHFYAPDDTVPAGFEQSETQFRRARATGIKIHPLKFRPDPELLRTIQKTLADRLDENLLPIAEVQQTSGLREATFLWPPLESTSTGLKLSSTAYKRLVTLPTERMRGRNPTNLFHMVVSTSRGNRNILMTPVNTPVWTDLEDGYSKLWVFYEGRRDVKTEQNSLSFLGAMFLPKEAKQALLSSNVIARYTL